METTHDDRADFENFRAAAVFIASACIPPARFWEVCLGDGRWQPTEREHLQTCDRCRAREEKVRAAAAPRREKLLLRDPLAFPAPESGIELGVWEFQFSSKAAPDGPQLPEEQFSSPDGLVTGCLHWSPGRLDLVVEVQPAALGDRLVRFELGVDDQPPLHGFVGLYPFEGGKGLGSVILTRLSPDLRRRDFKRCKLALKRQTIGELRPEDRPGLEQSRDASPDVRCRQVLDEALRGLSGADVADP